MQVKINLNLTRRFIAITALVLCLVIVGLVLILTNSSHNPLPDNVKDKVTYKVIYPSTKAAKIDQSSFDFQQSQNVLSYKINYAGSDIVFNQQPTPDNLGSDTQVYYPTLGIHPYAQFRTDNGLVALTKFWQSGTFKPFGQAAVMASNGTLLIAHSDENLTNQQWKDLFEGLKITK